MRNDRADLYKGFLIFSVVFGHLVTAFSDGSASLLLHKVLRTFDMPMFMAISGYFLHKSMKKQVFWKTMINKVGHILLPLLFWNLLFYTAKKIMYGFDFSFFTAFSGLWFLWAAFLSSIIVLFVCGIIKKRSLQIACFVVFEVILHFINISLWNLAYVLPFFIIGYYYSDIIKSKTYQRFSKTGFFVSILVFAVCLYFWEVRYNIWNAGSYVLENTEFVLFSAIFRFVIAIAGCITIKVFLDLWCKSRFLSRCKKALSVYGQKTMEIYILQSFLIETALRAVVVKMTAVLGFSIFTSNVYIFACVCVPVATVISIVVLDKIVDWTKNIPYIGKYLFGFNFINAKRM